MKTTIYTVFLSLLYLGLFSQNYLWIKQIKGTGNAVPFQTIQDNSGNYYVFGYFNGQLKIENSIINATGTTQDVFISKFSNNGNLLWLKQIGGAGAEAAYGLKLSNDGNAIYFTITFNSNPINVLGQNIASNGSTDILLAKINLNGDLLWAKNVAYGSTPQSGGYFDIDSNGDILICGTFNSSVTFYGNQGTLSVEPEDPVQKQNFIAKYSADGDFIWSKLVYSTSALTFIRNIAANGNGYIVGGNFSGQVYYNSTLIANLPTNYRSGGLFKTYFDGNLMWNRTIQSYDGDVYIMRQVFDNNGNQYIAGYFSSSRITFDSTASDTSKKLYFNVNAGTNDLFLAKYTNDGTLEWAILFGGTKDEKIYNLISRNNELLLGGSYIGKINFGDFTLPYKELSDAFLVRFNTNGDVLQVNTGFGRYDELTYSAMFNNNNRSFLWIGEFKSDSIFFDANYLVNDIAGKRDGFIAKWGCFDSLQLTIEPVSCSGMNDGSITALPSPGNDPYTYLWSNGQTTATISNLAPGAYTVTVTGTNGCSITKTGIVTEKTILNAQISSITNVNCAGTSTGAASVTAYDGNPPYNYLWSSGETTATIINKPAGIYYVTVSDQCNTTVVDTAIIGTNPPLSASISGTNPSCYGENNGTATVYPSNNNSPYSYLWNTGSTEQSISNLTAGTYTVTVTDACGASVVKTIILTNPTQLTASIVSKTDVSCYGYSDGNATIQANGGTSPYSYLWSNQATTASINNVSAGNYTVTVTDNAGCTATASVAILQPSPFVVSISSKTDVSCYGGNDGSATITTTGGNSQITITEDWEGTNTWTIVNGTQTNKWYIGTATKNGGTQSIYISNNNNTNTYTNTVNSIVHFYKDITFPSNASNITIQFDWKGIGESGFDFMKVYLVPTTTTPVAGTQLTGGQIGASYYGLNSDWHTEIINNLDANAGTTKRLVFSWINDNSLGTQPPAAVDNIIVSYVSTPTVLWSNGQTTPTATNLSAGNYTVTVTDMNGCTASTSVVITQPDVLSVSTTGNSVTCNNGNDGSASAIVSGGVSPYSYLWNNLQTTQTINNLQSGTYTVTVTDANGCTASNSYLVQTGTTLSLNMNKTDATCGNSDGSASVSVSGGTSPYSYLWSTGNTSNSINNLSPGLYTVTVTDYYGCSSTTSVTINNNNGPTATASGTNVSCNGGNNGTASVIASGGTITVDYQWTEDWEGTNTWTIVNGTQTNKWYIGTATNNGGTKSIYISNNNSANAYTINRTSIVHFYKDITFPASATEITIKFDWKGQGQANQDFMRVHLVPTTTTPTAGTLLTTGQIGGPYYLQSSWNTVTITGLDAHAGTTKRLVFTWRNNNNTGTQPPVAIDNIIISYTYVTPNPYTYQWSNGASTQSINNLSAGTYTVTVTDLAGCQAVSSVTITEPSVLISSIISSSDVSCIGNNDGSATVAAFGGTPPYSYAWNNPLSCNTATCNSLPAGTWTVTVTDNNGCTTNSSVIINEPTTSLTANITNIINVTCYGGNNGSATVTATGGTQPYFYEWSNGQTNQTATNLVAGIYYVTVTDDNGCTTTATATISQNWEINAEISSQTNNVCSGEHNGSATVLASGGIMNTLLSDDWEGTNTWTLVNGTQTNKWYIGTATNNGGSKSIYISNNNSSNAYTISTNSIVHFYKDITFPSNAHNITIKFDWKGMGEDGYDFLNVYLVPTTTTPVAGTALSSGLIAGPYNNQANYIITKITGLDNYKGTTMRLVFSWINDNSVGTQPPASIDNIEILYNTPDQFTYLWNTTPIQTTQTATGLANGIYTVTVTDANGCTATTSATITQLSNLTAEITSQTNVTCYGGNDGSATVTADGGFDLIVNTETWEGTNTWTLVNGTQTNKWYIGTATSNGGSKSIYISNNNSANSYTINRTSVVHFYKAFTFPAGATDITVKFDWKGLGEENYDYMNVYLVPTNINPTAGTQINVSYRIGGPYNSQNNYTTTTITGLNSHAGTTKRLVFSWINDNSIGYQPPVSVDNIIVSYRYNNYTYVWSTNPIQNTPTASNLTAGSYFVTVTDNAGCTSIADVIITQPNPLSVSVATMNTSSCVNNGQAMANPANGTQPYTYYWNTGSNQQTLYNLPQGTYLVTVTDACGATATAQGVIDVNTININYSTTCAFLCDGTATVEPTGGNPPYTYLWSDPNNQTTATATNLCVGNYTVTVTDALGCTIISPTINISSCKKNSTADDEMLMTEELKIYPNPASRDLYVELPAESMVENYLLEIYDIVGNKVYSKHFYQQVELKVDVSSMTNGMYVLQITSPVYTTKQKFIIQKE